MSQESTSTRPENPRRIHLTEESELDYWSSLWGVPKERIRLAVRAVGDATRNVRAFLGLRR